MTTETRNFKMHAKLLFDVIQRQAGSLSKAALEAVMNSVDAKATQCRILVDPHEVQISDDGQGFRSKQEIETWFEVFGQPHEAEEGKTYGTFRMGRGQMFAFGVNRWRTGKFSMAIDIKQKGLDYELVQEKQDHKGCQIQIRLYEQLLPSDLADFERDMEAWVKYCPIPVYLNNRLLSGDPAKDKWDEVTDEAYIRLRPNGVLSVYNLGIHVFDLPGHKYGTGGDVVCRQQVKVNFARNDIQSDCPVWQKVKKVVDLRAASKTANKQALNDDERQRIVDRLLQGLAKMSAHHDTRLITAATGRQYRVGELFPQYWSQITNAPKGNRKADTLMKQKIAFVIANETLDRFHVKTVPELLQVLERLEPYQHQKQFWLKIKYVPFEQLTKGMSDKYEVFTEDQLRPNERLWLALCNRNIDGIYGFEGIDHRSDPRRRKLSVGFSKTANGWTDGASYIVLGREFLAQRSFDIKGFVRVGALLLHEMCHRSPDLEDHDHDQAFYEQYHDLSRTIGNFAEKMLESLPLVCKNLERKMSREMLSVQDAVIKGAQAFGKFELIGQ